MKERPVLPEEEKLLCLVLSAVGIGQVSTVEHAGVTPGRRIRARDRQLRDTCTVTDVNETLKRVYKIRKEED